MSETLLRLNGVGCEFGATVALDGIDLAIEAGARHGIIGPNGSGKSTLFNVISGWTRPTRGTVALNGAALAGKTPEAIARLGVLRTFQYVQLCASQTVLDNLLVALAGQGGLVRSFWRRLDSHQALRDKAMDVLRSLGMAELADKRVADLAYGVQKQVELAVLFVREASVILLDEPTAGLSAGETEDVLAMLGQLDRSVTILIIEHDMDVLFGLAEQVTVLNAGRLIAQGPVDTVRGDPEVARVYLGTAGLGKKV